MIDLKMVLEIAVIEKELFDFARLVARADHEVVEAEAVIVPHDMQENRTIADLDHGLGFGARFFGESGAQAACEDENGNLRKRRHHPTIVR